MEPILVVGGGLAGLAAALALPGPVVLVDPRPREAGDKDRRSAAVLRPGRALLERLGVWNALASPTPLDMLRVLDLDTGRDAVFDSADLEGGGPFGWNVPNDAMRSALIDALEARGNVELAFGTSLASLTPRSEECVAYLSDGRRLRPPLTVGADGRDSAVRQALGIDVREWRAGQKALSFTVRHEAPHGNVSTEVYAGGGPLVLVPLTDPHESAVVWMERASEAERIRASGEEALGDAATERSGWVLGRLEVSRAPVVFPVVTRLADRMAGASAVLMAEAAHTVPPIGAQGLNMSLADVAALGEAVATGTGPAAYERARLWDVRARVAAVSALGAAAMGGPLAAPRAAAIGLLGQHPGLRGPLMRFGLGAGRSAA